MPPGDLRPLAFVFAAPSTDDHHDRNNEPYHPEPEHLLLLLQLTRNTVFEEDHLPVSLITVLAPNFFFFKSSLPARYCFTYHTQQPSLSFGY